MNETQTKEPVEADPESLPVLLERAFMSLAEAVGQLRERRADAGLLRRVREGACGVPVDALPDGPALMMVRAVFSADLEMERFLGMATRSGCHPWCLEMPGDRFVSFNADKHCRGKLVFRWGQHLRSLRVMDFGRFDGRRFSEIRTYSGLSLVEFHRRLLKESALTAGLRFSDVTEWMCGGGNRCAGYEQLLLLAVRDGILIENFRMSDPEERRLVKERVLPAMASVERRMGLRPLVVRLYDPHEEDSPECWQYPGGLYSAARALLRGRDDS
jgi:hypothetical protein